MKGKAKSIMKLKRNSLTTLLVVSFLLMALSGCGQQAEPDSAQPPLETVTYSNLTDADSRKLLTEALADANVDETRTKLLLDRVDQFNASVKSEWLTGGFESAAPTPMRCKTCGWRRTAASPAITAGSRPSAYSVSSSPPE